jgi:hypothetical protein
MAFPDDQVAWLLNNKPKVLRYTHGLQIIAGLALMTLGFHTGHAHFHLLHAGIRTQGRIIAYRQEQFPRSGSQTFPIDGLLTHAGQLLDMVVQLYAPLPAASLG